MTEDRVYFALTLLTGVLAGALAVFFHNLVQVITDFIGSNKIFTWKTFAIAAPMIFISGYITTRFYPSTSGSGIPGVRLALAVYHGKISYRSTIAKFITSTLSLAGGMSLGREGPTVAMGAGIGGFFGELLHMPKRKIKSLVAIGAAGGLAATFNTPMAAVVFTLEEVVGDLNAKMLGSIVIAAVIAAVTASMIHGNNPTFTVPAYELKDPHELIGYLVVGIAAAIAGTLWVSGVLKLRNLNKKIFKSHKLTLIMVSFCLIAVMSLFNDKILGSGHQTINEALLSHILNWKVLLSLLLFKMVASALCFSSGVSGGIFMPTLFIGSMLGAFIGSLSWLIAPDYSASIGAYAIVGMGAFFVSVLRAPFTAILMAFELTHDYKIILPLMVANTASLFLSTRLRKSSIYESVAEQDGIHLPSKEDNEVLENLLIEDAMITEPVTLMASLTTKEAIAILKSSEITGFPVMEENKLMGMISRSDIMKAHTIYDGKAILGEVATTSIFTIYPDQSLLVALHKLEHYHVSHLPVVSRINDKKLIGIITAWDIINRFGASR